jgi:dipeptidyl aminopeptidase/acylaminoacyl peptidase
VAVARSRTAGTLVAPLAAFLILSACEDATEPQDLIIEGVNLTELFAPPTSAELAAITADWETRDVSAQGVDTVAEATLTVETFDVTVRAVSHTVEGVKHYGAIMVPDGAATGSLPILLYAHGGDSGVNIDDTLPLLPFLLGEDAGKFVFVAPSFRAEKLVFNDVRYVSEGPPSPWDRDVDDALALINVAIETTPQADPTRVGVLGFSRGGGVALLMAERDPDIDVVVEFFGPTDFHGPFVQGIVEEALVGDLRDLPGLDFLNATYIQPLKNGDLTIAEVRPEITRRSAVYWAELLPSTQIHHGINDETVAVSQAERLIEVLDGLGRGEPAYEWYLYEGGTHNPLTMTGSITRARGFLSRLLEVALASG